LVVGLGVVLLSPLAYRAVKHPGVGFGAELWSTAYVVAFEVLLLCKHLFAGPGALAVEIWPIWHCLAAVSAGGDSDGRSGRSAPSCSLIQRAASMIATIEAATRESSTTAPKRSRGMSPAHLSLIRHP
jgi:hypothetical protein